MGVLRLVASAASAGAALVGLVTLAGWLAGLSLGGPDLTMKPATALAVLLIACAILPQLPLGPPWRIAFGVIAALLAASSLIQEFGGLDLRLETWLAPGVAVTPADFRMSPATALAVLLAGTAAALLPISRLRVMPRASLLQVPVLSEQPHYWVTSSASISPRFSPSAPSRSRRSPP